MIVFVDAKAAGCIALSRISENTCEMKRLFLREDYHGLGIGRKLVHMIVEKALSLNYSYMRLDTMSTMDKAQKIYESIGFTDIKPYRYNPIKGARFMELDLKAKKGNRK